MQRYEYKVVPAPTRGLKARGVKTAEARFANALETEINTLAAEGWEYLRADTLPSEERQGLTGTATHFRNVLVFRRALESEAPAAEELPTKTAIAYEETTDENGAEDVTETSTPNASDDILNEIAPDDAPTETKVQNEP